MKNAALPSTEESRFPDANMAKLIVISNDERQEFDLAAFNTIGRHPDNTIQILDRIISKNHAQVRREKDNLFLLRDLNSLNGTFVHGDRIDERVLKDGDEIAMGSTRLLFMDRATGNEAVHRVTIAPGITESHIRQRMSAESSEFLPAMGLDEETIRRDYERLRIGHELATTIGTELDLEKLLPKILDKAFELVGADRGAILLCDDQGEMVPRYVKTDRGKDDKDILVSTTVLAEVKTNKTAVLSSDARMDERFSSAHSIIMQGIRSTMTVPLLHASDLLGVMHLDSQIASNTFTDKDLQICMGMAAQAAVAIQNAALAERIEKEAETRAQLSRLAPRSVVEQIVKGELTLQKGGRLEEITMLFSDIRGFTAMSDGRPPEEVVNTLNEYFEVMVEVLFRHQGTPDKFVGDEIIGLFGAPIELEDGPYKAICCALDMLHCLEEFNRTRAAENLEPIRIGIGINTGEVITGGIGTKDHLNYTAIGDAMNVASRLVNIAKAGEIIISDATLRKVADRVETVELPPHEVKGKAEEQILHRVVRLRGHDSDWDPGPTSSSSLPENHS